MKKFCAAGILVAVVLGLSLTTGNAQQAPQPDFDNAPIEDVLSWAQQATGVGFIYEAEVLRRPGTTETRRITASHVMPDTGAERRLLMFELLRSAGLVAFEVGGLPGPTYRLFDATEAARHAPILDNPDEIGDLLFAGLTIRLRRASVQEVSARVRPRLSSGVGAVETFERTQTLIVTDFADRLRAAWDIAQAAEQGAIRDDDTIVRDFALQNTPADRATAALERLREPDEKWRVAVHDTSNVLLISGLRVEVEMVYERARLLDGNLRRPEFEEKTHTVNLLYTDPARVVRTLREMFERQIAAGSVQVGSFDRNRTVVFRGSEYDFERARQTIRLLDVDGD
jgi:type II secretory pathway component GspD/PulD (secretin)